MEGLYDYQDIRIDDFGLCSFVRVISYNYDGEVTMYALNALELYRQNHLAYIQFLQKIESMKKGHSL